MEIKLKDEQFNRLFPFYILIDDQLKIQGFGKSISKILPLSKGMFFSDLLVFEKLACFGGYEIVDLLLGLGFAIDVI